MTSDPSDPAGAPLPAPAGPLDAVFPEAEASPAARAEDVTPVVPGSGTAPTDEAGAGSAAAPAPSTDAEAGRSVDTEAEASIDAEPGPSVDAEAGAEAEPPVDAEAEASIDAEPGPSVDAEAGAEGVTPEEPGRRSIGPLGVIVAALCAFALVVVVLSIAGSAGLGGGSTASPEPSEGAGAFADGRGLGQPDAPVTIEIWADFQCPYCGAQAHGITPSLERLYAAEGRARIVYRDFVFLGQESLDAAVAARCAGQQGAFWYYHDLLFASQQGENQGAFARDRLVGLAQFAALDETAFTACLDDPAMAKAATDETAIGQSLGVTSTPVLRIDGPGGLQVVTGLQPLSDIDAAIELAEHPQPSASPGASASPGVSASPSASASPGASASPSVAPSSSPRPTPSPTP